MEKIAMSPAETKQHLKQYNKLLLAICGFVFAGVPGLFLFFIFLSSYADAGGFQNEHLFFLGVPGFSLFCLYLVVRWLPQGAASHKKLIAAHGVRN